jgi:hypothetical protein
MSLCRGHHREVHRCGDEAEVRQTEIFARWLANLRDGRARARINAGIRRLSVGNPGDAKSVGGGVSEMRIDYGPDFLPLNPNDEMASDARIPRLVSDLDDLRKFKLLRIRCAGQANCKQQQHGADQPSVGRETQ